MDQLSPPTSTPAVPVALDRLSSLPDAIVVEILSLVPTKTAVTTSVLSTRWRSLWTQITSIHLNYNHFPQHSSNFYTIANHLLLTQLTSPILPTFYLHAPFPQYQHLESWLRHLSARNVQIIDINVEVSPIPSDTSPGPPLTIPLCIFQTQSLVCLFFRSRLVNYQLPVDPNAFVNLPNLKKLALCLTSSQCQFVSKLLSSCPLLEELSLNASKFKRDGPIVHQTIAVAYVNIGISCRILKRLQITMSLMKVKLLIDTPKLESFGLFGMFMDCCFLNKPIALSEAAVITMNPAVVAPIMPVLFDVRVLYILGTTLNMLEGFKDDNGNLLNFHNLTQLNLDLSTEEVNDLRRFRFKSSSSPCLLLKVKKISLLVSSVQDGLDLKELAHYFIRNAPALERLSFAFHPETTECDAQVKVRLHEMVFCMDLYSCSSQSSHQCVIEFQGQYAKVPANNEEFKDMENQVLLLRASLTPVDADAVRAS